MTPRWLQQFFALTENKWQNLKLNQNIYGYQIQPETKWLPGHRKL